MQRNLIVFIVLAVNASLAAHSFAATCRTGSLLSVTGKIDFLTKPGDQRDYGTATQWSFAGDTLGGDCLTEAMLIKLSTGVLPADCVVGNKFSAAGVLQEDEDGYFMMDPEKLACTPK